MEMTVSNAIILKRLLTTINLSLIPQEIDLTVDACAAIMPYEMEYNSALTEAQKAVEGKKEKDISKLVQVKAFEKIANKAIEIDFSLSKEQADHIRKALFTAPGAEKMPRTAQDYMFIYGFVKDDK